MMDAEKRSADEIRSEFEESGYPQQQLQIYEAIAKTFRDIVADYKENTAEARVRLLDKIRMNMANAPEAPLIARASSIGRFNVQV